MKQTTIRNLQKQQVQLAKWEKSTNPLDRLTTDFYNLKRHEIFVTYNKMITLSTNMEEVQDAVKQLNFGLALLQQMHDDDVVVYCELILTEKNIIPPGKIVLQRHQSVTLN